jgi:hypothetical protein
MTWMMGFGYVVWGEWCFCIFCGVCVGVVGVGNLSCIGQSSSSLQVTAFVEFVYS